MRPTESTSTRAVFNVAAPDAGRGYVALDRVGGRTIVSRLRANSPLKLLTPHRRSSPAWVIAGSYGGGLVSGDALRIDIHAGNDTTLFLGTQASTKIYRSYDGRSSGQTLTLDAQTGSVCVIAPDPITPFAGSNYEQRQQVHLADGASLVLVDWLTAGRVACGERWAFSRYVSRTEVFVAGRQVFRDGLLLDSADGRLDGVCRTGGFDCLATAIVIGPAVEINAAKLLRDIDGAPVRRGSSIVFSASPVGGGTVLRAAGPGSEAVGRWLRDKLAFIADLLGEDPWARNW